MSAARRVRAFRVTQKRRRAILLRTPRRLAFVLTRLMKFHCCAQARFRVWTQRKPPATSPASPPPPAASEAYCVARSATEQRQQAVFSIEQLPHEHVCRCQRCAARSVSCRRRLPQARRQEHVRDDQNVAAPDGGRIKANRHRAATGRGQERHKQRRMAQRADDQLPHPV